MINNHRIIVATCLLIISTSARAAEPAWQGPPVVATMQIYSRSQPAQKMSGKLYVNREGFRSEMPMGSGRDDQYIEQ